MYNYMQPIVASIAAIIMGLGVFGWEKGVAIALVFLGVYIVTKSKSKADFEKEGKKAWISYELQSYKLQVPCGMIAQLLVACSSVARN